MHMVIQTEHLAEASAAWLAQRCRLERCGPQDPRFDELAPGAAGLDVRTYTRVDEALLARCPGLRVVGRAGVGLDNIDVAACRRRGVEVVYTPDANTQAVVEYVICQVAPLLRPAVLVSGPMDRDAWQRLRRDASGRPQASTMTLGILGLGRIGRGLARAAAGLGFGSVLYHDLLAIPPASRHGARPAGPDDLFAQADVLSIHVDGRDANRGAVGRSLLRRMKPEVIFVNTSRGFVVDSLALAEFLADCPRAVAVLDVHEAEPFQAGYPLLGLPNARLLPHLGAATAAADRAMSDVVHDVAAVLEGRPPACPAP